MHDNHPWVGVTLSNVIWLTRRISGVVIIITVPSTLACALNHIWFKDYSLTAACNLWSSFVMSRALGHSWWRISARFFATFFNWRHRLARSSTVISTDGFGGAHFMSFIVLNMSATQKLVSCGSTSAVILLHYFWYWVPMLIQNFKIWKFGSLLTKKKSFRLLFAVLSLFPIVWVFKSLFRLGVLFRMPNLTMRDI